MDQFPIPSPNYRLGYHYFPDTFHYRQSDLQNWLPVLKRLAASWLVVKAPSNRVIPESFINGLISENIFPILQFEQPLDQAGTPQEIKLLLSTYARWGIKYILVFDQPNNQIFWKSSDWAQGELVELFLDRYTAIAKISLDQGIFPIFPPLHPGGDYWDLVFLRSALRSLVQRGLFDLINFLTIGGYASTNRRALDWGTGGQTRWACARPYYTPPGCQDHRGVNIADWYSPIIKQELGKEHPLLLFKIGDPLHPLTQKNGDDKKLQQSIQNTLKIVQALTEHDQEISSITIPPEVMVGCFPFLSSIRIEKNNKEAILSLENINELAFSSIVNWLDLKEMTVRIENDPISKNSKPTYSGTSKPINHYLLLPVYAFGVADWDLDAVRPFIVKNHPTIGFSYEEACTARHVTILDNNSLSIDLLLNKLRSNGCKVDTLKIDGTNIAS